MTKRWLLIPMATAMLGVGALGTITAFADSQPPKAAAVTEAGESATETAEPGDAALPGGGHDDGNLNANANNQFDGVQ